MGEVSLSADWNYTVVYDGDCAVCGRLMALWIRWDRAGRLEILPSQTPGLHERFPQIPPTAYDESLQVIGRDGRVWQGAESFARVFEVLPGAGMLAALLGARSLQPIAERFYRWFAGNRYRFGCSRHCPSRPRIAVKPPAKFPREPNLPC